MGPVLSAVQRNGELLPEKAHCKVGTGKSRVFKTQIKPARQQQHNFCYFLVQFSLTPQLEGRWLDQEEALLQRKKSDGS